MNVRSLRWRLMIGAGIAILAAVFVAWVVMSLLFERHLERRLTTEMTRDATRLAAATAVDPTGRLSLPDPLTDPRLETPASGFYWQASAGDQTVRSRSLWDSVLPPAAGSQTDVWRLRRAQGPFDEPVYLLERTIRPDASGPPVLIQLAQDSSEVASARSEFGQELAMFLALLWLFLLAAAWLQIQLGLRPLARIRDDVATLSVSSSARLPSADLDELRPLTSAINGLAEAREMELRKARSRASDLAHGLKTPLAALRAQGRRIRDVGQPEIADGLDRAVAAITATTEAELARSRLAASRRGGRSLIRKVAEQIVAVIEQTDRGEAVALSLEVPAGLEAPMERDDLAELLGPLIENAARFARRQVRIAAAKTDPGVRLTIDDDGPGIASDQSHEALARGVRLDQTAPGTGLGLAIARDLVEASGGRLALTRSALGGLRAEVLWPG